MEGTVREKFYRTSNYAWVIFVGVCLCSMSIMVLGVMIFGVYLVPLAETTGAGLVAASLYMTVYGWVMAAAAIVYGWLYTNAKTHAQFKILNITVCIFGALSPLWNATLAPQFGIMGYYIGAGINGLSGGCFMTLVPMMMINDWFGPKFRGKFMGVASAVSVLGAMIWPPLFTYILQNVGMNMTYLANAAVMFIFSGIAAFFIFRKRDPDVLPWGVKSWQELEETGGGDTQQCGYNPKSVLKSGAFWLTIIITVTFTIHGSMAQNLVGATTFWLSDPINGPMIGAFGMSIASVGESVWKIAAGFVIDKFGAALSNAIFVAIAVIGLMIFAMGPTVVFVIYAGGIFFAAITSAIILGGPLMNIQLFGPKTFPVVQGYKGAVNTFLSGLTSPIVAMLIVSIGYSATYMIGGFIWIVPVVIYLIVNKFFIGKMPWVDGDGNPMPQADAIRAQKAAGAK